MSLNPNKNTHPETQPHQHDSDDTALRPCHDIASTATQHITMPMHDNDPMTLTIVFATLVISAAGLATSIFTLVVAWLVPSLKTTMPHYQVPPNLRHRSDHPEPLKPSLRRSNSSPALPVQEPPEEPQRPHTARHVSFNLERPRFSRQSRKWPFQSSSSRNSPTSYLVAQSVSPTSGRSSLSSESSVPVSTPSPHGQRDNVPIRCFDESCECNGQTQACSSDATQGSSSTRTSPRSSLTLSMRLPSMKKAFTGQRRKSSEASTVLSDISAPAVSSPPILPASTSSTEIFRARESLSWTSFPRLSKRSKPKPAPASDDSGAMQSSTSKISMAFSNPWSTSRRSSRVSTTPPSTLPPVSSKEKSSSRKSFVGRMSMSSHPRTPDSPSSIASSSSYFPSKAEAEPRPVPRTQPYGPPYNATMPGTRPRRLRRGEGPRLKQRHASLEELEKDPLLRLLDARLEAHLNCVEEEEEEDPLVHLVDVRVGEHLKRMADAASNAPSARNQHRPRRPGFRKRFATESWVASGSQLRPRD